MIDQLGGSDEMIVMLGNQMEFDAALDNDILN